MNAKKSENRRSSSSKKSEQSEQQDQPEAQQEQSSEERDRPTDQAIEDRQQSEIEVERQKRRERLGHFIPGESNPQDH